jgi:hypothetical protein
VPANQLLIRTDNVSTVYSNTPVFNSTAQYLTSDNGLIMTLSRSGSGNNWVFDDANGGSVTVQFKPYQSTGALGSQSASGNTVVGNYAIKDNNAIVKGANFVGSPVYVGNWSVTPKALSASAATGVSKVYDGTNGMVNAQLALSGQVAADLVKVSGVGNFSQKNVGSQLSYTFNNVQLDGADQANYYLVGGNSFTGNNGIITAAPLTVTASAVRKTYDGTSSAAGVGVIGNLAGQGDSVSNAGILSFVDKNAGTGKTVKASGVTIKDAANADVTSNYSITYEDNTSSVIDKSPLTFANTQAADKMYDGNSVASVSAGTVLGLIGSEQLSLASVTGMFDTPTPGENKPVTVVYGLTDGANGGLAANYDWSPVTVSARIQSPNKEQKLHAIPTVSDRYTRVSYLGFGGVTGAAVAGNSRTALGAAASEQACSAARLEECVCEESQDTALEICVLPTAQDMKK